MSCPLKRKVEDDIPPGDDADDLAPSKKDSKPDSDSSEASLQKDSSNVSGDDDTTFVVELSKKRRVSVKNWKGKPLVDIREYYLKNGKETPGLKGIALTIDQWKVLKEHVKEIDEAVSRV